MIPKALEGVALTCGAKPLHDKGHTYAPGEEIHDAAEWPNIAMHIRRGTVIASPPVSWRMVRPSLPKPGNPDMDAEKARIEEELARQRLAKREAARSEALDKLLLLDENTNIRRIRRLMSEAGFEPDEDAKKADLLKQIDAALAEATK